MAIHQIKISVVLTTVFFLTVLIITPKDTFSQRLPFRKYSVKEGLSQSQIFDIVQDHKGFIWFATAEGLTRFDGKLFVHYSKMQIYFMK